jgi:catechol 2,3-dioxygenase-like lactoylglutathione lyase family enzyme
MPKVHRLGYANLVTPDLERQVDYWTRVIGLQIVDRSPDQLFLATKLGLEAIVLERGTASHLSRISFQVPPDSDLGELAAALHRKGVKNERRSDISPGVAEAIVFRDPADVQIEVFAQCRFHAHDKSDTGIGPVKFGHVAHRVRDVQVQAAFYSEVLGFRTSDWIGDPFRFHALRR